MLVLACVSIDQSPSQSPPPRPNNDTGAGWGGNHTSGNKQQLELFTPVGSHKRMGIVYNHKVDTNHNRCLGHAVNSDMLA